MIKRFLATVSAPPKRQVGLVPLVGLPERWLLAE